MSEIQMELWSCSHSHAGWDFMKTYQEFKWSPGDAWPLTCWIEFHENMSGFKQSPGDAWPLTSWIRFHKDMSGIQIEHKKCTATHILDGIS
jgi:hypothetical protein